MRHSKPHYGLYSQGTAIHMVGIKTKPIKRKNYMNNYLLGSMKRYRQEQRREKWAFIIDASKVIGDLLLGLFVLFGFIIMFADLILAFDK